MQDGGKWRIKDAEYAAYIHSKDWRLKADERLKLDGGVCCVCGKKATDVHHLTYDNFRNERMEDLVSLCRQCHDKAEDFYSTEAMDEVTPEGNNFMAAMRMDASVIAPQVFEYIRKARGMDFDSVMSLRQPVDPEGKKYWTVLREAVKALCWKRYSRNCAADRMDMMMETITNRVRAVCLSQIEHTVRNAVQCSLHDFVMTEYMIQGKWKTVAESLGITVGTLSTIRKDDGTSFGPTLRETVLYYCGLDAVAGIKPLEGFSCLTDQDYKWLNDTAEYMKSIKEDYKCA